MLIFKQHKIPNLTFKEAIKKPIPIKCFQVNQPFEVETLEGKMKGKKGDWLMVGVNNELYPCDNNIFKKSYDLI